ncbi:MAG: S8 family peptidase [Candidatus Eremiobacterota bacterium]
MSGTILPVSHRVIVRAEPERLASLRRQPGVEKVLDLPLVDGFAATVDDAALERWVRGGVKVVPDQAFHQGEIPGSEVGLRMDNAARTLGLPDLWQQGYTGKGVTVAVIDTGIAPHPDLDGRIVDFVDLVNGRTKPYDDRGHGTHVAGIVAGNGSASKGRYSGAAPEAGVVGIKVFDHEGNTNSSLIIKAIQWAVENKERHGIRIINISIGAPAQMSALDDPVVQAVDAASQAGLLVVCSSGNRGPWPQTIDTPGISPTALTVGATNDFNTPQLSDDRVPMFSGSGPTLDQLMKPDLVAPGEDIISTGMENDYVSKTGTSMAAPLVAGIAALMFQVKPDVKPKDLKKLLKSTSQKIRSYIEEVQGKGVIQPLRAAEALKTAGAA